MIEKAIQRTLSVKDLTTGLIEATRRGDWGEVDNTLVPQLGGVNGSKMAQELLEYVTDENPDVRGVVATALASLKISMAGTRKKVITEMIGMATTDTQVFPAGGAAVFLLNHSGETPRIKIKKAIKDFVRRAQENEWVAELTENIHELRAILKT
ncbi:MAG TPA: hypothetical protein VMX76_00805 [Nevskiaceae bacterium]|nr:hypothetical protein [Nevskiaceae bacterium]